MLRVFQTDFLNTDDFIITLELVPGKESETFAKRPFLPNSCACPVECVAYSSGVRLKF
jgi:hypothetical protein